MNMANKIVSYMRHPVAQRFLDGLNLAELTCFDTTHTGLIWNKIYHRELYRGKRHYATRGGADRVGRYSSKESGLVDMATFMWGGEVYYLKIPNQLQVIHKYVDDFEEYVKLYRDDSDDDNEDDIA